MPLHPERSVFPSPSRRLTGFLAGCGLVVAGGSVVHAQELIGEIDISAGGRGAHVIFGDVTGDGRLDLVTIQAIKMDDDKYIGRQINCLTAFELTGEMIWQVGDPSQGEGAGADIPAQIYDIDGDGKNEVLACMKNDVVDGRFAILDGATGKVEAAHPYPSPEAHDTIIIANLDGAERPGDIILKDRYKQLWAMGRDWKVRFTFRGNVGHFPWPSDYDGDGREEVVASFTFLDEKGRVQWEAANTGHADTIWTGDIDQNPDNGREIAIGGDDVTVYSAEGKLLWRCDEIVEPQYLAIGDFRPDLPGLEVAGHDRIDRGRPGRQGTFLLSSTGELLWYPKRDQWLGLVYPVHNWDGKGADCLARWGIRGESPVLWNGKQEVVATFANGYLAFADIDADGSCEVLSFDRERARLYSHGPIDLKALVTGSPRQQAKMNYNYTRYPGGDYPPSPPVSAPSVPAPPVQAQ